MATLLTNTNELTSIADAIRAKGGTSNSLVYPTGFVSAIDDIQSGEGISFNINNPNLLYPKLKMTAIDLTGQYSLIANQDYPRVNLTNLLGRNVTNNGIFYTAFLICSISNQVKTIQFFKYDSHGDVGDNNQTGPWYYGMFGGSISSYNPSTELSSCNNFYFLSTDYTFQSGWPDIRINSLDDTHETLLQFLHPLTQSFTGIYIPIPNIRSANNVSYNLSDLYSLILIEYDI
jgi:hypothetical protein